MLLTRKSQPYISRMLSIIPCAILDLSWKFHEIHFTIFPDVANQYVAVNFSYKHKHSSQARNSLAIFLLDLCLRNFDFLKWKSVDAFFCYVPNKHGPEKRKKSCIRWVKRNIPKIIQNFYMFHVQAILDIWWKSVHSFHVMLLKRIKKNLYTK